MGKYFQDENDDEREAVLRAHEVNWFGEGVEGRHCGEVCRCGLG